MFIHKSYVQTTILILCTLKAYKNIYIFKRIYKINIFFFLHPVDHFLHIFPLENKGGEDINNDQHLHNLMVL